MRLRCQVCGSGPDMVRLQRREGVAKPSQEMYAGYGSRESLTRLDDWQPLFSLALQR